MFGTAYFGNSMFGGAYWGHVPVGAGSTTGAWPNAYRAPGRRLGPQSWRARAARVGPQPVRARGRHRAAFTSVIPLPPSLPPMYALIDPTQAPYSCVPGQDCTAGLQAALDYAKAHAPLGVLLSQAGDWIISKPLILDGANVGLYGLRGAKLKVDLFNPCDPLIVGIARTNMAGRAITSGNFLLNGSIYGARLFNPSTSGTSFIQVQNHPFMYGPNSVTYGWPRFDYWSEVQRMAIDMHFDKDPSAAWQPGEFLFGLGDVSDNGTQSFPYSVWVGNDPDTLVFKLRTADIPHGRLNPDHQLSFSISGLTRPYKIRVVPDLVSGTLKAYDFTTGSAVEISSTFVQSFAATQTFGSGNLHFAENLSYPFMVGMRGQRGNFGNPATKLVLYGFQVAKGINPGAFNPTVKTANTIAYFPAFTPSSPYQGRFVPVGTGPDQGDFNYWGTWFNAEDPGLPPDWVTIDGLHIECAAGKGAGVLIGSVFDLDIRNCRIGNGAQGIGNLNIGENWPVNCFRNRIGGFDTAHYGYWQIMTAFGTKIDGCGFDVFRSVGGSVEIIGGFSTPDNCTRQFYSALSAGNGGGNHAIRGWVHDAEGQPSRCGVYMEQHAFGFTTLELDNCSLGLSSGTAAILLQRENATNTSTWRAGQCAIRNLGFSGYTHAVTVKGGVSDVNRENGSVTGAYNDTFEW